MSSVSVWLFNIKPNNWRACVDGPPNLPIHGSHVNHPYHGLSARTAWKADRMVDGETALVRQSGEGVMGIWEIKEISPIESQSEHNWEGGFDRFIYCQELHREFAKPLEESFVTGQDFARFNAGANQLSDEDAILFIENTLEHPELSQEACMQLEDDLNTIKSASSAMSSSSSSSPSSTPLATTTSDNSGIRQERKQVRIEVTEAFRNRTLERYNQSCLLTDIRGSPFVTLAHILPRAEYENIAEHPENVLILNWLHHRAFDAELFTFDEDLRIRVHPEFSPENDFLKRTLASRDGDEVQLPPQARLKKDFITERNEEISWFTS